MNFPESQSLIGWAWRNPGSAEFSRLRKDEFL
jgi:hypothetical protein